MLVLFVLFFSSASGIQERLSFFKKNIKLFTVSFTVSLIVFIPQLVYWSQSFNKPIVYSYGDEGFTFLFSPKLILVWFSTNNGLFTYAPILLISIIGLAIAIWKKNKNGMIIAGIFLVSSYVFSSWWNYWFGCAMGARSFVEYYPLLMFPFAYAISQIKSKTITALFFIFCAVCISINLNIIYYYDGCFYGSEWDWNTYFKLITD